MAFFDYLSASALSLVVSGNTGISPFLSLWIVGICERVDPTLLNMTGNMEALLSSWPALIVLGVMTLLEFLAKCIPVIDEIVDSAMVFLVPVMSAIGSLSTFGVFDSIYQNLEDIDMSNVEVNYEYDDAGEGRMLEEGAEGENSVGSSALMFLQVMLVTIGIGMALLIHLFKMLVRLFGEGCLTNFITIVETTWIAASITIAIYIRPIAIGVAIILGFAAAYGFNRWVSHKFSDKDDKEGKTRDARGLPLASDDETAKVAKETAVESTNLASTASDSNYVVMKDT